MDASEVTAIFIPTLGRPDKLQRVADNIHKNTIAPHKIYFIVELGDEGSIRAALALGEAIIINEHEPCYAGAINTAYEKTTEPYFFTGADDLDFHPLWLETAILFARMGVGVVGTNDLGQIPIGGERDATHYLVSRQYIDEQSGRIDAPKTVLYPYQHNYTDKEFIEVAKSRGQYRYVPESVVEHLHPVWGKGQNDETYKKGVVTSNQDQQLYMQRQHLWQR